MGKTILLSFFLFSFFIPAGDDLQTGIQCFNNRAVVVKGLQADPANIEKAIKIFETELSQKRNLETAGFYYLQSLNFKGRFVLTNISEKKALYNKAIAKGNEMVALFPKNGPIRFALITSIGLLGELNGAFKSVETGVLQKMLYHSEVLISIDSMYDYGAGWKVLAILNYKTPAIPVVLTWPSKTNAKLLLQKALNYFPADISNNFYYAEALLANGEEKDAKIYFNLAIKFPTRKELLLEDEYLKKQAREYLIKLQ